MKPFSLPVWRRQPRHILAALLPVLFLHPATSSLLAAPVDPLVPTPLAGDRYKALSARSPFSPPTAEAPPPVKSTAPPPPGWGEKYTLGGLAQFGAGYKVTLNPKNPVGSGATASSGGNNVNASERLVVITGEANPDGITLSGVQWNDDPKQTRATLVKNGVPAQFTFDATALTTARGNAASAATSVPAPRASPASSSSSSGFVPPAPFPNGTPSPGIVRSPGGVRAPIRPPPPATGPNGMPLGAPPPSAPVRIAPPQQSSALPGNTVNEDDD